MQAIKCIVIGHETTAKGSSPTRFLFCYTQPHEYCHDNVEYYPTVFDNYSENMTCDGKAVNLGLCDSTTSHPTFDDVSTKTRYLMFPQTNVVLILYEVFKLTSFQNVDKLVEEVQYNLPKVPYVIAGMIDSDFIDKRTVSRKEGLEKAQKLGAYAFAEAYYYSETQVKNVINLCVRSTRQQANAKSGFSLLKKKPEKKIDTAWPDLEKELEKWDASELKRVLRKRELEEIARKEEEQRRAKRLEEEIQKQQAEEKLKEEKERKAKEENEKKQKAEQERKAIQDNEKKIKAEPESKQQVQNPIIVKVDSFHQTLQTSAAPVTSLFISEANVKSSSKTDEGQTLRIVLNEVRKQGDTVETTPLQDSEKNSQELESKYKTVQDLLMKEINAVKAQLQAATSNHESAIKKSDELTRDNAKQTKALSDKVLELEAEQKLLMREYEKKQRTLQEQDKINQVPEMRVFYNSVRLRLSEILLAFKVLNSGLVQRSATTADSVIENIKLAGEMVPIPFVSTAVNITMFAVKTGYEYNLKKKNNATSDLVPDLASIDDVTERAARNLAQTYKPQILKLKTNSAKVLGECGVRRMVEYIRAGLVKENDDIVTQLVESVKQYKSHQGMIPFTNKSLDTRDSDKDKDWTDEGIFQKTGIQDAAGKYYISKTCKIDKYGFRVGTAQEAHLLTMTEVTQPQMVNVSKGLHTHITNIHQNTVSQTDELERVKQQLLQEQAQRIKMENDRQKMEADMEKMRQDLENIKNMMLNKK